MKDPFRFLAHPEFNENPSLIVGWKKDTARVADRVIGFLNERLCGKNFCDIEPAEFFSFSGVSVEDDIIQFPESRFFYTQRKDLLLFMSDQPDFRYYEFLDAVLNVVANYCKAKGLFTINGMVSYFAHTAPRRIFSVFNNPDLGKPLQRYGLEGMTWDGSPAMSSYLLWEAKRRGVDGVSIWVEVPFYFAVSEDPRAVKLAVSFLDRLLGLNLNLDALDLQISEQDAKIESLKETDTEIARYLDMLENGKPLGEEAKLKLVKDIYELLRK